MHLGARKISCRSIQNNSAVKTNPRVSCEGLLPKRGGFGAGMVRASAHTFFGRRLNAGLFEWNGMTARLWEKRSFTAVRWNPNYLLIRPYAVLCLLICVRVHR
jgi:hypothetical protein